MLRPMLLKLLPRFVRIWQRRSFGRRSNSGSLRAWRNASNDRSNASFVQFQACGSVFGSRFRRSSQALAIV